MTSGDPTAGTVRRFLDQPRRMLIGGQWVESRTGETLESVDPATGRPLTTIPRGDATDVDQAVRTARTAFESAAWREITPIDRGQLLDRLADLIEEHADELALLEAHDNGKPVRVARAVDVGSSAKLFRYFAGWPSKFEGSTVPVSPRGGLSILNYTVHEPVGVVGAIVPWNFPMSMACWKLAPALATGNTVVLKPAEETSLSTLRLAELIQEAGFPDGVVNVVTGTGPTAGAAIAEHAGIDKVAFTGSTNVGRLVARAATGNLKKVSLELGGKSPNIVFDDCVLEDAVSGAISGIFAATGQTCIAGSRLLLQETIHDQFVEKLVDMARQARLGDPAKLETQVGPVTTPAQYQKILSYIDVAKGEGAKCVLGGGPASKEEGGGQYFVKPTIFTGVNNKMRIAQEEVFGPVLSIIKFKDEEEAVAIANDIAYGLGAGIWTQSVKRATSVSKRIRAGTVWVNTYRAVSFLMPFGGYKASGLGRENGAEAIEGYLQTKSVWINNGPGGGNPFIMKTS